MIKNKITADLACRQAGVRRRRAKSNKIRMGELHNCILAAFGSSVVFACCILSGCEQRKRASDFTFTEHIAPIIHKNCTPCHRPGEAGPFPLITYQDVLKKAKTIKRVTEIKFMPPWPADRSYSTFLGEWGLTDEEIQMIGDWVDNHCPPGDPSIMPPPPRFPEHSQLGKPDLVLKMKEPFMIPGDNKDHFMVIKIPFELPSDTFIRAIEFVPGNRALVHHMNGHLVQYEDARKKNVFEGKYVTERDTSHTLEMCYNDIRLLNDDGSYPLLTVSVANYLPGMGPIVYPEGLGGWKVKRKGAFLMRDQHYGPTPVPSSDQSYINIFFSDKPPVRQTMETQLGTLGISEIVPPLIIPPDTVMTFKTHAVIQNDIALISINPHMHLLGKSYWAFAVKPGGDTLPLIRIPEWDFRWQYTYTFKKMLHIPKGTAIWAYGTYDNTTDNPNNPFFPPREVSDRRQSMSTTDEMFQFIMTYVPYRPGDENISLVTDLNLDRK